MATGRPLAASRIHGPSRGFNEPWGLCAGGWRAAKNGATLRLHHSSGRRAGGGRRPRGARASTSPLSSTLSPRISAATCASAKAGWQEKADRARPVGATLTQAHDASSGPAGTRGWRSLS